MVHARLDYNRIQDPEGLIPVDEPVFLVRAQDLAGPATVRAWASYAALVGAEPEIVSMALLQADRMEQWQTLKSKVPDLPPVAHDPAA